CGRRVGAGVTEGDGHVVVALGQRDRLYIARLDYAGAFDLDRLGERRMRHRGTEGTENGTEDRGEKLTRVRLVHPASSTIHPQFSLCHLCASASVSHYFSEAKYCASGASFSARIPSTTAAAF